MYFKIREIIAWPLCVLFLMQPAFNLSGDILCIGDNGHVKLETFCLPCCGENEELCEDELPDGAHHEHSNCSDCSDIVLNGPLRVRPVQKFTSVKLSNNSSTDIINPLFFSKLTENKSSPFDSYHLVRCQSPPSLLLGTTVLLC